MCEALGLTQKQMDHMIDLTGNPISALKLAVMLAAETRKLVALEEHGKIKLPAA
jgi:exosome complex RNA-binding protein Rrp42 (RNase PH superfamily)